MRKKTENQYNPDYLSLPGETLLETLQSIGMSQVELAKRTGRPKKTINRIIKGKVSITPDTALQFESVLGIPARFWNNRESQYREALARLQEHDLLQKHLNLLKEFPLKDMVERGWIKRVSNKVQQFKELLRFFGVATPKQLKFLWLSKAMDFRKSPAFKSNPYAVAAWLRKGEIEARSNRCKPFDPKSFKTALNKIRGLTNEPPEVFVPETERLCAESGVTLVFVPELPETRASGVARWLNPDKAIIQLSLRYGSDDHLWFTFFHEAAHILLHSKKAIFIERDAMDQDGFEEEANKFAADILIPPLRFRHFIKSRNYSKEAILNFASDIGISPGIVLGRLQHDGYLSYSRFNDLKRRFVLS